MDKEENKMSKQKQFVIAAYLEHGYKEYLCEIMGSLDCTKWAHDKSDAIKWSYGVAKQLKESHKPFDYLIEEA